MKNIIFIISFFFISIGYSQDFWQQTNGPGGGTVNSLTQNSKGYIFAATDSGVYRSIDNGDNWTLLNNGLPPTRIKNIATNNDGHIFAGISSKGVFRSTDNGDTWVKINNGLPDTFINALTVNSNGDLFTTPSGGIYRSTDNGNNWVQVYSSLQPKIVTEIDVVTFCLTNKTCMLAELP